jgi:hypothetical protein
VLRSDGHRECRHGARTGGVGGDACDALKVAAIQPKGAGDGEWKEERGTCARRRLASIVRGLAS